MTPVSSSVGKNGRGCLLDEEVCASVESFQTGSAAPAQEGPQTATATCKRCGATTCDHSDWCEAGHEKDAQGQACAPLHVDDARAVAVLVDSGLPLERVHTHLAEKDLSSWTHCLECGCALVSARDKMMSQGLCQACALPLLDAPLEKSQWTAAQGIIRPAPLSPQAMRDYIARRAGVAPEAVGYAVVRCDGSASSPQFGERGIEELVRARAARWALRAIAARRALSVDERWSSLALVGPICLSAIVIGVALYAPANVFVTSCATFAIASAVAWRASLSQARLQGRRDDSKRADATTEVYRGLVAQLDARRPLDSIFAESQQVEKDASDLLGLGRLNSSERPGLFGEGP